MPSLFLVHKVPYISPILFQHYGYMLNHLFSHMHMRVKGLFPVFIWVRVRVSTNSLTFLVNLGPLKGKIANPKWYYPSHWTSCNKQFRALWYFLNFVLFICKCFVICCTYSFLISIFQLSAAGACMVLYCDCRHRHWGITPTITMHLLFTVLHVCYHCNFCFVLPLPRMWVPSTLLLFIKQWLFILWYVCTWLYRVILRLHCMCKHIRA